MRPYGRKSNDYAARGNGRGGRGNYPAGRSSPVLVMPELKLLLLSLFDERERHGYELIRLIKAKSRGAYAPSPGMIYPALAELSEEGFLQQVSEGGGRKAFKLAEPGRTEAAARAEEAIAISERLAKLGRQDAETQAPLRRAMANLELALEYSATGVPRERIDRIVELLDRTAREIERLD